MQKDLRGLFLPRGLAKINFLPTLPLSYSLRALVHNFLTVSFPDGKFPSF